MSGIEIHRKESSLKVIRFYASWCRPCHTYEPVFKKIVVSERNLDHEEFDVDQRPDLAELYGVTSLPTTIIVNDQGEVIAKHGKSMSDYGLRSWLDKHITE